MTKIQQGINEPFFRMVSLKKVGISSVGGWKSSLPSEFVVECVGEKKRFHQGAPSCFMSN